VGKVIAAIDWEIIGTYVVGSALFLSVLGMLGRLLAKVGGVDTRVTRIEATIQNGFTQRLASVDGRTERLAETAVRTETKLDEHLKNCGGDNHGKA
jgi:hypothetical protein